MSKTVVELAAEMNQAFITKQNRDGKKFTTLKDDSPQWMVDVCRMAHQDGDIIPNDFWYEHIANSICEIATNFNYIDFDATDDLIDCLYDHGMEFNDSTYPEINTTVEWLAGDYNRQSYVNIAIQEYDCRELEQALAIGMVEEKKEIWTSVCQELIRLSKED